MKSGWANGWRGIFALVLLTGAASTRAQAPPGRSVTGAVEEEPKIVAIRMVKEDGQELSNTPSGIAAETGKTLDQGKIADSLRAQIGVIARAVKRAQAVRDLPHG